MNDGEMFKGLLFIRLGIGNVGKEYVSYALILWDEKSEKDVLRCSWMNMRLEANRRSTRRMAMVVEIVMVWRFFAFLSAL